MPILDIEIITKQDEDLKSDLAAQIADAAGKIFGSDPGGTWVKLHKLARSSYAENGGGPDDDIFPVFVNVIKGKWPSDRKMANEAAKLSAEIARICDRPRGNVHILYLPSGEGRIFFGGVRV